MAKAKAQHTPLYSWQGILTIPIRLFIKKYPISFSDLGVCVINEEVSAEKECESFRTEYFTISQWAYPNRILHAANWAVNQDIPIHFVQMNSFWLWARCIYC